MFQFLLPVSPTPTLSSAEIRWWLLGMMYGEKRDGKIMGLENEAHHTKSVVLLVLSQDTVRILSRGGEGLLHKSLRINLLKILLLVFLGYHHHLLEQWTPEHLLPTGWSGTSFHLFQASLSQNWAVRISPTQTFHGFIDVDCYSFQRQKSPHSLVCLHGGTFPYPLSLRKLSP